MIDIYYCLDDKYFSQLLMSVISLVNNTNQPLNVIALTIELEDYFPGKKKLSEIHGKIIQDLLQDKNPNSKFTIIDVSSLFRENLLDSVNINNKFYHYLVTMRLVAHKVREIGDKVIYLDTDVIFQDDVKKLWEIDNSKYELIGRKEPYRLTKYINTGVMLLNMKKIRESGTFDRACERCRNKKIFAFIDMTALNYETNSIKYISKSFNSFKYNKDNIIHHLCVVREGKVFLSKKWRHRIKPDEPLIRTYLPQYDNVYKKFDKIMKKHSLGESVWKS